MQYWCGLYQLFCLVIGNKYYLTRGRCACLPSIQENPLRLMTYDAYPSYPSINDPEVASFCQKVNAQLIPYRTRKGIFARDWEMMSEPSQPENIWQDANGAWNCSILWNYIVPACLRLPQFVSASILNLPS